MMKCFAVVLILLQIPAAQALPVKPDVRVKSSAPREIVWKKLSKQEKRLAYHLQRASRWGRSILFHQSHRHSLTMKKFFENVLSERHLAATKKALGKAAFEELLGYVAKFQDLQGPYSPSNRKYVLEVLKPAPLRKLLDSWVARTRNESVTPKIRSEIVRLMTDPAYEMKRSPEDASGKDLEASGGNLYEKGVTGADVTKALASGFVIDLNCRIVKVKGGKLRCEKQTVKTPGPVGVALTQVVRELRRALPLALTPNQKKQIEYTIKYFQSGNIEDFRQANIAWVKDRAASKVDFMMGFVEVYSDYQGKIGSWESYVQIVDPETTHLSQLLAQNAQYFENLMPFEGFKKKFPLSYAPPALMVYYFQEIAEMRSGGYNLPNFDDIRRDVGFKNVIRLDLPGEDKDPVMRQAYEEAFREFMPSDLVDRAMKHRDRAWRVLVLLHEIIGHGSGTYDTSRYASHQDPISALGPLGGSALEEQRADLAALTFFADQKLVDIGVYKDKTEAIEIRNAAYDIYLTMFLLKLSRDHSLSEAHQRGHWLFINRLLETGAVAWVARGPNEKRSLETQVLRVQSYDQFQTIAQTVLAELQRIKALRDEAALIATMTKYAPLTAADEPWAKAVIKRGENLAYNAGTIEQPWAIVEDFLLETLGGATLESVAPYWLK